MCISIPLKLPPTMQLLSPLCSVWRWGAGREGKSEREGRLKRRGTHRTERRGIDSRMQR